MLSHTFVRSALALLVSTLHINYASAQVTTTCNPLEKDCPADPAFGTDFNFNFNATPKAEAWETTVGPVEYTKDNGASFVIKKQGDSPTIRTKFYIFFGRVEVIMKAAEGRGIISSVMFLSQDLDEIDWEFMGGNRTHGQTNYYGKGRDKDPAPRAVYHPMTKGPQEDYHNYTTVWRNTSLDFYIDGQHVRTLLPKDANNTNNYPQTPSRVSIGIWAGGDPSMPPGTREWAGGDTDYSKVPFTMNVKSCRITDFNSGKEYQWGDRSGKWESIKVVAGNSTSNEAIHAPPELSTTEKFNNLPQPARIAIYASAAGLGVALFAFGLIYCIRQRRRGAREAKLADERNARERMELDQLRAKGLDPDSFADPGAGAEYNANEMRNEGRDGKGGYSVPSSPANEKAWGAAALGAGAAGGVASGMRSPMPLLHSGAQSPRVASPGPPSAGPYGGGMHGNGMDRMLSPAPGQTAPLISPMRTPSPGGPPSFPPPASPGARSFSSPNPAPGRMASPGPGYGGDMQRMHSPGPMGGPMGGPPAPQRSFTNVSGFGPGPQSFGGSQGYGGPQQGYGGQQQGYGGGQDPYWR